MRPLLAITVSILIVGGLRIYMSMRDQTKPVFVDMVETSADGVYSLDVTLSFDAGRDPFAFELAEDEETACVEIKLRGEPIFRETESVASGTPILISPVEGIVEGRNEFFISASPAESSTVSHAVRVRVFRDGDEIANETKWSEPGQPVKGTVEIEIAAQSHDDSHEH